MPILTSSALLARRAMTVLFVLATVLGLMVGLDKGTRAGAAVGDGPTPCTSGPPPDPFRGFCATYNGANTWFGSYGPGFPTAAGWAFCAEPPASGSPYPSPSYAYQLSGPPPGADTSRLAQLGYAFSNATVQGFWDGAVGVFTADQAAAAAKLLYDDVAWHTGAGTMDPGVQAAYTRLLVWMASAAGATGPPGVAVSLVGGGTTFTTSATIRSSVAFPGSGSGVPGVGVLVGLTNATFDGTGGATSALGTTDENGRLDQSITATGGGPVTVSVTSLVRVGQPGLQFFRPSAVLLNAQTIVAGSAPIYQAGSATFSSSGPPPSTGTISVIKSGDDTAYYPVSGAQFEIRSGSSVVATLVTDTSGAAGPTGPLTPGTYTVHESVAPPGYQPAPDQTVVVVAGENTVASFTGDSGDQVIPATLTLRKVASSTLDALAGAVLSVRYDEANDGVFSQDLGTCTTAEDGTCRPAGNDGSSLRPGRYRVEELMAPPGYAYCVIEHRAPTGYDPDPTAHCTEVLAGTTTTPPTTVTITVADVPQPISLSVAKTNASQPGVGVPGATYDLYARAPYPAAMPDPDPGAPARPGLRWFASGITDESGHLTFTVPAGHSWCLAERTSPVGFVLDPGLHCTAVLDRSSPDPVRTVAMVEHPDEVIVRGFKFNATAPNNGIPGASYALFVQGAMPPGFVSPPVPPWLSVPPGLALFAISTSDATGALDVPVPVGHSWCLLEVAAPAGYARDPGLHCTAVLDHTTAPSALRVALPELANTGADLPVAQGLGLIGTGAALLLVSRRRRRPAR